MWDKEVECQNITNISVGVSDQKKSYKVNLVNALLETNRS